MKTGEPKIIPSLSFPDSLFGREEELRHLEEHYRAVESGGSRIVMVKGSAGSGKTALVREFCDRVSSSGALVVSGKYDQYRNDPYHAIRTAVNRLAFLLLTRESAAFHERKEQVERLVEPYGHLLLDFAPEWKKILTEPREPLKLGPQEQRNVLTNIIAGLFSAFSDPVHPLILFLDDLQWIDEGSCLLLRELLSSARIPLKGFLCMGTFREEEIEEAELFRRTCAVELGSGETSSRNDAIPFLLCIVPFDRLHTEEFIAYLLGGSAKQVQGLTSQLYRITGGNALRIREMLRGLVAEHLLLFRDGKWRLRHSLIDERGIGDGGTMAISRTDSDNPEMNKVLTLAACIGGEFSLFELSVVSQIGEKQLNHLLSQGVEEGLLVKFEGEIHRNHSTLHGIRYRFAHDLIRYSFYHIIAEDSRAQYHLDVAQSFEKAYEELTGEKIYDLAYHYNRASELMNEPEGRTKLIRLNYGACRAAFSATAWEEAYGYAEKGLALVDTRDFSEDYRRTLLFLNLGIETAFLTGHYETMERWTDLVEEHAVETLDKARGWKIEVQALVAERDFPEAVRRSLEYSRRLGKSISVSSFRSFLNWNPLRRRYMLSKAIKTTDGRRSPNPNPRVKAYIDILSVGMGAAYLVNQNAFSNITAVMFRDVVFRRQSENIGFAYICLGFVLIMLRKYGEAKEVSRVGLRMTEENSSLSQRAQALFFHGLLVDHWHRHLEFTRQSLQNGFEAGIKSGNFEFASLSISVMWFYQLLCAKIPLPEVEREMSEALEVAERLLRQKRNIAVLRVNRQWVRSLMAKTEQPLSYDDDSFSEAKHIEKTLASRDKSHLATYYVEKLFNAYLLGEYGKALEYAEKEESVILHIRGQFQHPLYYYLYALTLLSLHPEGLPAGARRKVRRCMKKVEEVARAVPINHGHRIEILRAEYWGISGEVEKALDQYASARRMAEENGSLADLGIINERFALYFRRLKIFGAYREYLRRAYACFERWGAKAKMRQLEESYPGVFESIEDARLSEDEWATVFRTTRAIAKTPILDNLLKRFLESLMKLTESERGCFVSAHAEGLELRFLGAVNTEGTFSVISRGEVEGGYPEGILNYALRTSETLFYEHLELEGFRFDPYIKEREPETVLCMPIHTYGEIKTLLYLENGKNIGSLATPVRELTESIAVQAALTIESGRLYERERELEHQNREQLLHLMEAEKSASIGFLIAEIAHEVNNPNQAISLNADTLSNLWADTAPVLTEYAKEEDFAIGNLSYTDFREEYPKIIKAIRVSSRQIHYLVQELRAFMQPKRSIELRKMDVNAILRSTILIASHFINQATERFSFEEGCLPKILCDDRRLQQVFLNLIRNSCQSLTDTGKAIKIVSRLHEKEETVEIVVEDEGCGMEASQLQKIGEPFFTSRSDQEGTGLGLYVSKAILREHGGHMKVESREGEGTKVSVILPVCER